VESLSHIVEIKSEVRDPAAVQAACRRLSLAAPVFGIAELYSGQVNGWAVRLPDWRYPVIFNPDTGEARFDNFGGHWGQQKELGRFLQAYAVEKAKIEARRQGHGVTEQRLADGSIKLTVQVAGGAS
jgi:hypothetical protein